MTIIDWDHVLGTITPLPAKVDNVVFNNQKVYIHWSSKDPAVTETLNGLIILQLSEEEQRIESTYTNASNKTSPPIITKKPFTLTGSFTDSTFSEYQGFWTEDGDIYEFYITGLCPPNSRNC